MGKMNFKYTVLKEETISDYLLIRSIFGGGYSSLTLFLSITSFTTPYKALINSGPLGILE